MEGARSVATAAEVEALLASPRCSFVELLDAIEVAAGESRWDLVDAAGRRALIDEVRVPARQVPSLVQAARSILVAYLSQASSLGDLPAGVQKASETFERLARELTGDQVRLGVVEQERHWLDELRLLLSDDSVMSRIKLCSKLREIDRPSLGVEAATAALAVDPDNTAARTTRAAALMDLETYEGRHRALADCRRAWALGRNEHTATAYSRVCRALESFDEAVEIASWAFEDTRNSVTAHTLLAAAVQAGDEGKAAEAGGWLRENGDAEQAAEVDEWIAMLAVRSLFQEGRLHEVGPAAQALLAAKPSQAVKKETVSLLRKAKEQLRKRQTHMKFDS